MRQVDNHIIADEGKVFRRIEDSMIYGSDIYLGYSYYIGGELLSEPHLDVPEDFEEIDDENELTDEEVLEILTGQEKEVEDEED
jgi:hypothetical protein